MADPAVGSEAGTVESACVSGQNLATNDLANEETKIWLGSEVPSFPWQTAVAESQSTAHLGSGCRRLLAGKVAAAVAAAVVAGGGA